MRTDVIRGPHAVAATVVLALVTCGCTVQGAKGTVPPVHISHTRGAAAPSQERDLGGGERGRQSEPPDRKDSGSTAPRPSPTPPHRTPAPPPSGSPVRARVEPAPLMALGTESSRVRELQARLRQLSFFGRNPTGYYGTVTTAAVTAFQKAHGLPGTGTTDRTTWQKIVDLTDAPGHDALYPPTTLPLSKPDKRCLTGRVMCISKKSRTLAWMIDGRVVSAMDVRFGSQYTPTRDGAFSVYWKSRHHVSTLYDSPMPYAMFFSGGEAVHYSSDFAARGYAGASHGCVNVRDEKKIAALYAAVRTGDKVVVY